MDAHLAHGPDALGRPPRSDSGGDQSRPLKHKQTRNKPTLSCLACVAHKTKCDRGRPTCQACLKRASECSYTRIADVMAAADPVSGRRKSRSYSKGGASSDDGTIAAARRPSIASPSVNPPIIENVNVRMPDLSPYPSSNDTTLRPSHVVLPPIYHQPHHQSQTNGKAPTFHSSADTTSRLLSGFGGAGLLPSAETVPTSMIMLLAYIYRVFPLTRLAGVFGMGGKHPFANIWTSQGGLIEVLGFLPAKHEADMLIVVFFEVVDPLYPIVDKTAFLEEYERFWALSSQEKCNYEPALVSLQFVIYATATQCSGLPSSMQRTSQAETYISAGHQALRLSSYLNRISIATVQTMILFFYFLINDNHISDAWTFSGITQRQAYVLKLNRDPDVVVPHASIAEKNLRCKLWASIVFQESTIALSMRLPSTSLQCDVGPHNLDSSEAAADQRMLTSMLPVPPRSPQELTTDVSYCKSIWSYALFVQQNICKQRALDLPICRSNSHKRELISTMRSLYQSFPAPFGSYDPSRFHDPSTRVARQQIGLSQSFFHAMMLICADESAAADVRSDTFGALEAAHEAMAAFFAMNAMFGDEINGWWAYQHKAFEEATLCAELLAANEGNEGVGVARVRELAMLRAAKKDVGRLLGIMSSNRVGAEVQALQERRFDTLQALYDTISVV